MHFLIILDSTDDSYDVRGNVEGAIVILIIVYLSYSLEIILKVLWAICYQQSTSYPTIFLAFCCFFGIHLKDCV